jgi:hypothetical protein
MRTVFFPLMLLAVSLGFCGGCQPGDSAHRVELYRATLAKIEAAVAASDAKIVSLQEALTTGSVVLKDVTLSDQSRNDVLAGIAQAQAVLTTEQQYKAKLTAWLTQTQAALAQAQAAGGIDLGTELGLVGQAVSQGGSALPGPAGGVAVLGGLLVSLAGNVLQKRRNTAVTDDRDTHADAMATIVNAVESLPGDIQGPVKAAIGVAMAKGSSANALVDAIKKG